MKKILIALAMIGITYSGAEAQTKGAASKKDEKCIPVVKKAKAKKVVKLNQPAPVKTQTAKTYQVCRDEGGYYTCCLYNNTSSATSWK